MGHYSSLSVEISRFSIWNAMMGTSILTMPWAIHQAGFASGIVLLIVIAALMAYTAYRVITTSRDLEDTPEYSSVVKIYLGRVSESATILCSVLILLGASIVYWIIMSSSLYHIVIFLHDPNYSVDSNITITNDDVICQDQEEFHSGYHESFKNVWDETKTVPLFLVILVFPLINIKSPTFFTKFTAVGSLFVLYKLIFVSVKAAKWGIQLSFDKSSTNYNENFSSCFPALTGVASVAFFIHNAIIPIIRLQRHPEHNIRDLVIAFSFVCATYLFIGVFFYASFPLDKDCVKDNFLENMSSTDIMSFLSRIGAFFHKICVLPLLVYILRVQLLQFFFDSSWPSVKHVLILNTMVVSVCVLFTIFLPQIGRIIGMIGAFCGLSYAIALPCLIYLIACHREGTLTAPKLVFHCLLISLGIANFIAQFLVIGCAS